MANPLPLVALAGDDLTFAAGTSFAFEIDTEDTDYPATNLLTGDPAVVTKSTTNIMQLVVTTTSQNVVAVVLINTNATSAAVNDEVSGSQAIVIPAVDYDGQRIHGWLDRQTAPLGPSTTWHIAISRTSGPVWIGHIALLVDIHPLNLKYGLTVGRRRPGDTEIMTRLGSALRYGAQIRTRWARGMVDLEDDEALMRTLEASAKGVVLPFVFIPDEASNDAWLVKFASNDWALTYPNYGVREVPVAFEELSGGPPNG